MIWSHLLKKSLTANFIFCAVGIKKNTTVASTASCRKTILGTQSYFQRLLLYGLFFKNKRLSFTFLTEPAFRFNYEGCHQKKKHTDHQHKIDFLSFIVNIIIIITTVKSIYVTTKPVAVFLKFGYFYWLECLLTGLVFFLFFIGKMYHFIISLT